MSIILASLEKHVMFKFNYLFSFFGEGGGCPRSRSKISRRWWVGVGNVGIVSMQAQSNVLELLNSNEICQDILYLLVNLMTL